MPLNKETETNTLGQIGPGSNGNEEVLYTPQIPEQEPHHQMQFNVIPFYLYRGYNQYILSPANTTIFKVW